MRLGLLPKQTNRQKHKVKGVITMDQLPFALAYAIAAAGCGIGLGLVGAGAVQAAGRNPEALGKIRTLMILAMSFVDALAIIGLVVALIAKFLK